MSILGVDFGTKRCGVAVSNELGIFAVEVGVWNRSEFISKFNELAKQREIDKIVVGLPSNLSGQDTEITGMAREFADEISKKTGLPVDMVDERYSTAMARGLTGSKRAHEDSLAALILLQNYLDKQNV